MIGKRLKELRKEKRLSQEELSKILQLSRATYAQYEIDRRIPEYGTLEKLADYYKVSIDFIVGRSDAKGIIKEEGKSQPVEEKDANIVVAEKLLSYLSEGLTNEEIRNRMDFVLDIFKLEPRHADEFIDFVRDELMKKKQAQTQTSLTSKNP